MRRMFGESRLFRLIVGEVEKTLCLVDLKIAREYAGLVADAAKRDAIFALVEQEFTLTCEMILRIGRGAPRDRRTIPKLSRPSRAPAAYDQSGQSRSS